MWKRLWKRLLEKDLIFFLIAYVFGIVATLLSLAVYTGHIRPSLSPEERGVAFWGVAMGCSVLVTFLGGHIICVIQERRQASHQSKA